MQFNEVVMPARPGEKENPGRPISDAKLNSPLSGGAFRPRLDDVYEFNILDNENKTYAEERDITGSEYTMVDIAATRNEDPSWIGLGQLTMLDADMKPVSPFAAKMREYRTVKELLVALTNKKIKVVAMEEKEFIPYGQTARVKRQAPIFEFVD